MKLCNRCKETKNYTEFNKNKSNKDGYHYYCKSCRSKERINNFEKIKIQQKEYYEKNKDELLLKNKNYRNENKEKINIQRKDYRKKNIEHIKNKNKEYLPIRKLKIKEKRKKDKNFQLKEVLRSKFHRMIKGINSSYKIILDCEFDYFKLWIEFQFDKNMNWDNFGTYWELDHILPLYKFNFENEFEKNIAFNWTNLQPLKKEENRKKYREIHLHYYFNSIINIHRFIQKYQINFNGYQKICESRFWLRKNSGMVKIPIDDPIKIGEMGNQQESS